MRQLLSFTLLTILLAPAAPSGQDPEPGVALFKSGVEQVAVAVTVRDARGKLVTNLKATDFELFDDGRRRTITNVWSEPSPASIAILMDASGSMSTKMERAQATAELLVSGLKPGLDEVALYAFDTSLNEVRPFTTNFTARDGAWSTTKAFGATSLWDAIADTAQKISDRQRRRALVVITDGVDSASKMLPSDVSAIASSLDVPVYILVITFALDEEGREIQPARGPLADLAAWTGGDSLMVRDTPSALASTQQVLGELQQQYVIAFEPGTTRGWHPIVLRTRKSGLFVRTRSGYMVK